MDNNDYQLACVLYVHTHVNVASGGEEKIEKKEKRLRLLGNFLREILFWYEDTDATTCFVTTPPAWNFHYGRWIAL